MSGHPQWKLLTCALLSALIGCQSSGKPALPWLASKGTNKTNHSNAERGDLKPAVAEERFASNTSQSDSEPTPAVSSEKVAQLIREGQALLQKADSNDPHSAQLEEARQLLSEAVQLSPNSHQAHHSLAIIADLQKDWKAAEEHYKQALSQRPQDASLLNDLGY
jgi:tetratricopeptide (TPR) repeat protein